VESQTTNNAVIETI